MGMRSVRMALLGAFLPVFMVGTGAAPPAQPAAPAPEAGYHHLGATTQGSWAGVRGRMTVTNPAVRPGSYDFVATRFMAKSDTPGGARWLEAGWAETGWAGEGRQRVYTFDTNANTWTFYDQYPLAPGEQIWISLAATATPDPAGQAMWSAWLWWRGGWHLLTAQPLRIGVQATLEQYVEVYVDPARGGTVTVPMVSLADVTLAAYPGAAPRPWTGDTVASQPGSDMGGYCVDQRQSWQDWSAGSC